MKAWYRAKRSGKLKHEPGHDDHYHIRVKHPDGSPEKDNVPCDTPNPGKNKQRQPKINVTTQRTTPPPRAPFRPGSLKF